MDFDATTDADSLASFQAIYGPDIYVREERKVLRQSAFMWTHVYANVFMGMDESRVEYRVDGGDWQPMRKIRRPAPWLLAENAQDDLALCAAANG